jgi:hypothetical protein
MYNNSYISLRYKVDIIMDNRFDGFWTINKLEIVGKYINAYANVL